MAEKDAIKLFVDKVEEGLRKQFGDEVIPEMYDVSLSDPKLYEVASLDRLHTRFYNFELRIQLNRKSER